MSRLLLDTNAVLLIGFESGSLPQIAWRALAEGERFVSHVCAVEMAIKQSVGKLRLPPSYALSFEDGFKQTVRELAAEVLPINVAHIDRLSRLPFHHRDPFDRLLISQALTEGLTVVTRDAKFGLYTGLDLLRI